MRALSSLITMKSRKYRISILKTRSYRRSVTAVITIHRRGPSLRLGRHRRSTMSTRMNLSVKCTRQRKTKRQSCWAIKFKSSQNHMKISDSSKRRNLLVTPTGRKWSAEIREKILRRRSLPIAACMYSVKSVVMFVSQRLNRQVKRLRWARSHSTSMTWKKEMITRVPQYREPSFSRSEIRNLLPSHLRTLPWPSRLKPRIPTSPSRTNAANLRVNTHLRKTSSVANVAPKKSSWMISRFMNSYLRAKAVTRKSNVPDLVYSQSLASVTSTIKVLVRLKPEESSSKAPTLLPWTTIPRKLACKTRKKWRK